MKRFQKSYLTISWILFSLFSVCLFVFAFFIQGKGPQRPRNIVIVSIDTLRADRLQFYGYEKETAPYMGQLASKGTVLEQFYSHTPRTLPSHITLLTSKYYSAHGVAQRRERDQGLAPGSETLASVLGQAGYRTVAFTDGGWLVRELGINEGFDEFYQSGTDKSPYPLHDYPPGFENIAAAATGWIGAATDSDQPFFMFLHCYDVHDYFYSFPGGLRELLKIQRGERIASSHELASLKEAYDKHIAALDNLIRQFCQFLQEQQIFENTLFIILSDHGEAFGEHGTFLHGGDLFQESIRIPCILTGPDIPSGYRCPVPFGLVDILPTVCSWAGAEYPKQIQGRDILPFLYEEKQGKSRRPVFSEIDRENNLKSVISLPYKSISFEEDLQIYDLMKDPEESTDISEQVPKVVRRLQMDLEDIVNKNKALPQIGTEKNLPDELQKRLQDLGYTK